MKYVNTVNFGTYLLENMCNKYVQNYALKLILVMGCVSKTRSSHKPILDIGPILATGDSTIVECLDTQTLTRQSRVRRTF